MLGPVERDDLGAWPREKLLDALRYRVSPAFRREMMRVAPVNLFAAGFAAPLYTALRWIVAREAGIPSVVAVPDATRALRDGEPIEIDGEAGTVSRLEPDSSASLPPSRYTL